MLRPALPTAALVRRQNRFDHCPHLVGEHSRTHHELIINQTGSAIQETRPRRKKRPVRLTEADREELVRLTTTGVHPVSMIRRAQVLLALDTSAGEVDPKEVIAGRLGVSGETLRLVAKRFAETDGDVWVTIARKKAEHPPVPSPVTGEVEARLIALACSTPPPGRVRWSLRLLETHVALIEDIPDLDHSTIGRVLKKRSFVLI